MFLVYIWYPFLRGLTNGRLKKLQTAAVLPLDAIQDDIEAHSINIEQKCNQYNGCIAQDGSLVQQGVIIAYKGNNNQVVVPYSIYYR